MALMKPGPIGLVSGNLAGAEIALTRNGPVIKKTKRNRSFDTPRAIQANHVRRQRIDEWHALDAENVRAWQTYANTNPRTNRLGTQIYLTAFQQFMRLTYDKTYYPGWPSVPIPPKYRTEQPTSFSASITAGGAYNLTITHDMLPLDYVSCTLWVARWLPAHRQHAPTTWIRLRTTVCLTGTNNWYTSFNGQNQQLRQGENVAIKLRLVFYAAMPSMPVITYTTVL